MQINANKRKCNAKLIEFFCCFIKKARGLLPKLHHLKFIKTTMSSKSLIELFNEAPHLHTLQLIQCDSLFMTGFLTYSLTVKKPTFHLSHLTELNLSKNRYLTDFLLNVFLSSAPLLERLDISFCALTKTNYKSLANATSPNIASSNSTVVLTVENLSHQLSKLDKLKGLNLSGIDLFNNDNSLLAGLVNSLSHKLEEVYLSHLSTLKVS